MAETPKWLKEVEKGYKLVPTPLPSVEFIDHYPTHGYIYYLGADGTVYMHCTFCFGRRFPKWYKFVKEG